MRSMRVLVVGGGIGGLSAALLVSIRHTATAYGVDDDLVNEWATSQPHLAGAWRQARQQSHEKDWRWS